MEQRRNTRQRQIVLEAVRSRCDHPTAEQIYEQIHVIDEKLSRGTVYRNLAILAEEGSILKVKLAGADRFDLTTKEHAHLICTGCGKAYDVPSPEENLIPDGKVLDDGFVIKSHQVIYEGLCPDCAKKQKI